MEQLTITEIAKLAFVSRSVVSRVLNDHPNVSETTRQRVLNVVKKYNYRPNSVARSLVTQNTYNIAILTTRRINEEMSSGYWTLLYLGMCEECLQQGYFARISFISTKLNEDHLFNALHEFSFDGCILLTQDVTELVIDSLVDRQIPVVFVGHDKKYPMFDSIDIDNFNGAYKAVSHLLQLGHTRIGIILSEMDLQEVKLRMDGYKQAHLDHGIAIDSDLVSFGSYTPACGYNTVTRWIDQGNDLTALFCTSDTIAMGAISALNQAGYSIPEDVAIVGFDGLPITRYTIPPLTTIQEPIYEKGKQAVQMLINKIEGKSKETLHVNLRPELIIRQSCGFR